jgi:hypothetical protein
MMDEVDMSGGAFGAVGVSANPKASPERPNQFGLTAATSAPCYWRRR